MQYRRFGQTNLYLSVFSLGTMRYLDSQETATATIRYALEKGVNHLETARGYGKSEVYLGTALTELLGSGDRGISRENIYITSKLPNSLNASEFDRAIDESLERLQVDYLDGLALHGLNTEEQFNTVVSNGCIEVAQNAIQDGRIRHLGFSTHGSLELILKLIDTDLFEFVSLHYYYFFQRHAAAIARAYERDLGIFIISPADKGGRLYTPPSELKALTDPFSPLELNYRFLLSDPRITTLSIGAAKPEELDWPLNFGDRVESLTAEEREVLAELKNHARSVLGPTQCSQCYECLPCPENIHIPEVLRLRNLAVAYQMVDYGQYRYRMFENAGHWFPGMKGNRCTDCGECLPRCPEELDIPTLLRDTHDRLKGKSGRRLWE
ncbi:MAG: aldo/keto reductase [Cyanobacteria bacterium J007]|nr:MAG: aldo/keto reductase [Cyanobacteria bacterium J007]